MSGVKELEATPLLQRLLLILKIKQGFKLNNKDHCTVQMSVQSLIIIYMLKNRIINEKKTDKCTC